MAITLRTLVSHSNRWGRRVIRLKDYRRRVESEVHWAVEWVGCRGNGAGDINVARRWVDEA